MTICPSGWCPYACGFFSLHPSTQQLTFILLKFRRCKCIFLCLATLHVEVKWKGQNMHVKRIESKTLHFCLFGLVILKIKFSNNHLFSYLLCYNTRTRLGIRWVVIVLAFGNVLMEWHSIFQSSKLKDTSVELLRCRFTQVFRLDRYPCIWMN